MKKLFTSSAFLLSMAAYAQPNIVDGSNMPPLGYSDTIAVVLSGANPGAAGANVTWDFSAQSPMIAGKFTFVDPATTPYGANFSSATHAIELTAFVGGTMYEYYTVNASKWEVIGSNITGSGGDDYTANGKTILPFPFAYSSVVTDTFTKQSSTSTVTITYDGYGTLITPFYTYSNVLRTKRDFGGSDYYYDWYITSPYLMTVATYDNNNGRLTFIGKSVINSIHDIHAASAHVTVAPNPVHSKSTIRIHAEDNIQGKIIVTNVTGSVVAELPVYKNEATFSREGLSSGLYFYNVVTKNGSVAKGKFIVE